jgi:polysaccharide export outer membrane protein
VLLAGQSAPAPAQTAAPASGGVEQSVEQTDAAASARDQYRLGPEDQLSITVRFADELNNKTFTVDSGGFINIPFAGRVKVLGLTVVQLEQDLAVKFKPYFKSPDVVVNIVDYGSKPVSVVGEVQKPAVHQLRGKLTLMELLSASGGLTQEAGSKLQITRQTMWGPLPLQNAHPDASGTFSIGEVNLSELLAGNPAENILLCPNDTVSVPRARLIYVLGDVHKPGGFPLREAESASVLQAIALAQGPMATASRKHVHILRTQLGGVRQDIPINLEKILDREHPDVLLQPEDVLYVPNSKAKNATLRGLETAIQMGTGLVIWGRY